MNILKNKKTLSIDFGSSMVKIVEGKVSKKSIVIHKNFSVDIPKDVYHDGMILDIHQLGDILGQQLKRNGISANRGNGVINSSHIFTREISIPKMTYEEIRSLLSYQIDEYIPIESDEYIVQFIVLDLIYEGGMEKLNLLLVGVPKDMVKAHLSLFKNLNIKPHSLDFQGNAIAKLINFNEWINDSHSFESKTIASVDIGHDSTKLTLIEKGNIKVTRVLDIGAFHILGSIEQNLGINQQELEDLLLKSSFVNKENEQNSKYYLLQQSMVKAFSSLFEKIELIFRYYRTRELNNTVNLILLQGGIAEIEDVASLLERYFNIESINIDCVNKLNFTDSLSRYSNAIGGLIRINEVKIWET